MKVVRLITESGNDLSFVDEVIASDANTNLKSINKRKVLQERYGDKGYDYAGNSSADIVVWAGACHAIVVNASSAVQRKASQVASVSRIFPKESVANVLQLHDKLFSFGGNTLLDIMDSSHANQYSMK